MGICPNSGVPNIDLTKFIILLTAHPKNHFLRNLLQTEVRGISQAVLGSFEAKMCRWLCAGWVVVVILWRLQFAVLRELGGGVPLLCKPYALCNSWSLKAVVARLVSFQ